MRALHSTATAVIIFLAGSQSLAEVKDFSHRFAVALTSQNDTFGLTLAPTDDRTAVPVNYKPNTRTLGGIQFTAYGLTLAYRNTAASSPQSEKLYGDTSYEDIRGALTLGSKDQWLLVGYYNRYSGLYINNSFDIDPSYRPDVSYMIRPDISIFNSGFGALYVVSPEKFSLAAAVLQSAQQTESAGSFLLLAGFDGTLFSATDALVPTAIQGNYGADAKLTRGEFSTVSLAAGYGYTLTKYGFFLTGIILYGPGYQWRTYTTDRGEFNGVVNAAKGTFGASLGYNGESFFIGASFVTNTTEYPTSSIRITTNLSSVRTFIGVRF